MSDDRSDRLRRRREQHRKQIEESPPEPVESPDEGESDESVIPDSQTGKINRADLPFVLRRQSVKDERENVHQLFVQDETDRRAKRSENELEELLGEDVYRLDAREAIYLAGMQHLDEAASVLREWGYGFFDE